MIKLNDFSDLLFRVSYIVIYWFEKNKLNEEI